MAADNNDHKILLIPSQNYASSVRSVISERLFTISGGIHSPSVVDTDFAHKELLCLVFGNDIDNTYRPQNPKHTPLELLALLLLALPVVLTL